MHRVLAAALLLVLAGCAPSVQPAPVPEPSTPAVSSTPTPSATPVASLAVGECTGPIDLTGTSITSLPELPCDQPHHYEVYATAPIFGDLFPGATALADQAETTCPAGFVDYVGVKPEYSRYSSAYLVPDATAWDLPANRVITCLVGSPDGGLVGSAKGDSTIFPKVGQCTGPQTVPATEIEIIDCASEHNYEVFADEKISGKSAPTKAELDKLFTSVCLTGFKKFVGVDAGKSKYEVTYFAPGEDAWTAIADHRIVCSAGAPDGGITGTLKGAKK